jgi:hypothetical protein
MIGLKDLAVDGSRLAAKPDKSRGVFKGETHSLLLFDAFANVNEQSCGKLGVGRSIAIATTEHVEAYGGGSRTCRWYPLGLWRGPPSSSTPRWGGTH